jgi:hypothetical protein
MDCSDLEWYIKNGICYKKNEDENNINENNDNDVDNKSSIIITIILVVSILLILILIITILLLYRKLKNKNCASSNIPLSNNKRLTDKKREFEMDNIIIPKNSEDKESSSSSVIDYDSDNFVKHPSIRKSISYDLSPSPSSTLPSSHFPNKINDNNNNYTDNNNNNVDNNNNTLLFDFSPIPSLLSSPPSSDVINNNNGNNNDVKSVNIKKECKYYDEDGYECEEEENEKDENEEEKEEEINMKKTLLLDLEELNYEDIDNIINYNVNNNIYNNNNNNNNNKDINIYNFTFSDEDLYDYY